MRRATRDVFVHRLGINMARVHVRACSVHRGDHVCGDNSGEAAQPLDLSQQVLSLSAGTDTSNALNRGCLEPLDGLFDLGHRRASNRCHTRKTVDRTHVRIVADRCDTQPPKRTLPEKNLEENSPRPVRARTDSTGTPDHPTPQARLCRMEQKIDRQERKVVYTDIEDTAGDAVEIDFVPTTPFAAFKNRAEAWLRDHLGEAVVAKVRSGQPLTAERRG